MGIVKARGAIDSSPVVADGVVYSGYDVPERLWGISVTTDQQVAELTELVGELQQEIDELRQENDGNKIQGGSTFTNASLLPMPFDYVTDEVDFEEHTLICVFAGDQDAEGYAVRIRGITEDEAGSLLCHYSLEEPSRRRMMMGGMSQPYMIVAIPKTDAEVRFKAD